MLGGYGGLAAWQSSVTSLFYKVGHKLGTFVFEHVRVPGMPIVPF